MDHASAFVQSTSSPTLPTSFSNGKAQTINQLYRSVGPGVVDITTSSSQNTSGIFGFGQGAQEPVGEVDQLTPLAHDRVQARIGLAPA